MLCRCVHTIYINSSVVWGRTYSSLPDFTLKYTHGPVSAMSIAINWTNSYPECFTFSISVDGVSVNDSALATSFNLVDFSPSTTYRVCVEARDGNGDTQNTWKHCKDITTAAIATTACECCHKHSNSYCYKNANPCNFII